MTRPGLKPIPRLVVDDTIVTTHSVMAQLRDLRPELWGLRPAIDAVEAQADMKTTASRPQSQ